MSTLLPNEVKANANTLNAGPNAAKNMSPACATTCPKCGSDLTVAAELVTPEPISAPESVESPGLFSKVKGMFGFGGARRRSTHRARKARRNTRRRRTTQRKH